MLSLIYVSEDSNQFISESKRANENEGTLYMKHLIVAFTIICLLQRMRSVLGLEAMCEYLSKYESRVRKLNPDLDLAVNKAMAMINIEKIYNDAMEMNDGKKNLEII